MGAFPMQPGTSPAIHENVDDSGCLRERHPVAAGRCRDFRGGGLTGADGLGVC